MDRTFAPIELDDRGSFAWVEAGPAERASTAIVVNGGCLVCDPVDAPGLDAALAAIGPVLAVWTLLGRHRRDGDAVARRSGADWLTPAAILETRPPAGVQVRPISGSELLVWVPDRHLLVVPESLGTVRLFKTRDDELLGVHPIARLRPPRPAFAGIVPEVIAVGHGPPLREGAAGALEPALLFARRGIPRAYGRLAAAGLRAALRRRAASRA